MEGWCVVSVYWLFRFRIYLVSKGLAAAYVTSQAANVHAKVLFSSKEGTLIWWNRLCEEHSKGWGEGETQEESTVYM